MPQPSLQGDVPPLATPAERNAAMDQAFDYRGDVTLHLTDGSIVEGYVYDRRSDGPEPYVRVIPSTSNDRLRVPYQRIARIVFTGRDTAAGKSWETWVRKYLDQKARGESAGIQSDSLD